MAKARRVTLGIITPALVAALSLVACDDDPGGACEGVAQPVDNCFDVCSGFARGFECVEGEWVCAEQRDCGEPCGPYPSEPPACVDYCGREETLVCDGWKDFWNRTPGTWRCPAAEPIQCVPPPAARWSTTMPVDAIDDIAADGQGNVLVLGRFSNIVPIGGHTLSSQGERDVFVAKLDPQGAVLWAVRLGGALDDRGLGLDVDLAGRAVVACAVRAPSDSPQLHIVALDADGSERWRHESDVEPALDNDDAVAMDASGNAVISFPVASGGSIAGAPIPEGGFVVLRLDAGGAPLWMEGFGETDAIAPTDVDLDDAGHVFVAGLYRSGVAFGDTTLAPVTTGWNAFVLALGALGDVRWARGYSDGYASPSSPRLAARGGGAIVGGAVDQSLRLDDGTITEVDATAGLVMRFSPSGSLLWSKRYEGALEHEGYAPAIDGDGNVLIAGVSEDKPSSVFDRSNGAHLYLAGLDAEGLPLWQRAAGAAEGGNAPTLEHTHLAVGGGIIAVGGILTGILDVGTGILEGGGDVYIAAFHPGS